MKCEILTFQYAHNYGAQLQCYALKKYIESLGFQVSVSNFVPDKEKAVYRIKPVIRMKQPRVTIGEIRRAIKRQRQFRIFKAFISEEINPQKCNNPDYIVIGSDQIWNENITGEIDFYYGSERPNIKTVSYAGSFGVRKLTPFQRRSVTKYLPRFTGISLREACNIGEVESIIGKRVESVLDPVFLLKKEEWECFGKKPLSIRKEPYILYYSLRQDEILIERTKQLSKELGCKVVSVHPICKVSDKSFTQLRDIGPKEFVYLVRNAAMVCTNSFHAVSFSAIFRKKLLYKAFSEQESRVPNILSYADSNGEVTVPLGCLPAAPLFLCGDSRAERRCTWVCQGQGYHNTLFYIPFSAENICRSIRICG